MSTLQDFKDNISREVHGISIKEAIENGICISCKRPPIFYSEAGRKEYRITGLCEPCFDKICEEGE
jgi:hypothetical protein